MPLNMLRILTIPHEFERKSLCTSDFDSWSWTIDTTIHTASHSMDLVSKVKKFLFFQSIWVWWFSLALFCPQLQLKFIVIVMTAIGYCIVYAFAGGFEMILRVFV